MKAIIFGASKNSERLYSMIKQKYEVVAYADNDEGKWGGWLGNCPIIPPDKIPEVDYDEIIIVSITALYVIQKQLIDLGVDKARINLSYMELQVKAREQFLRDYAQIVYENNIKGNVAEAGVFQGEFAKTINEMFPDRKCYLFDTFEGFNERDIEIEKQKGYSDESVGHLNLTSEEMVLGKMRHTENCIIRKGYFPETAVGIQDTFCFVNLDMDLYKPTLEGLKFFWERMEKGGIILVHDYFGDIYKGVRSAVEEFRKESVIEIPLFPIGDSISIAMIKYN